MRSKQRILIPVIVAVIFIFGVTSTKAGEADLVSNMNLTKEQIVKLGTLIDDFSTKALDITSKIDNKYLELEHDLQREDRFDTKSKARTSARNVNKLVKNISSLYGDLLKLRVEYLLKAKDVFTDVQKAMLIEHLLDFDMDMPDNFSYYLEFDIPSMGLDLSKDQVKKLLKYRADMDIMDIKLELDMNNKFLDLQDEILAVERQPQKINTIIMTIADLSTKLIDNQVNYILKSKDVLTVEQKRELLHMMMMM
jgi:hypothetical protein